ncbi:DnaJ C-terminal domain-containing protein [Phormidesmis sp. 146-20]
MNKGDHICVKTRFGDLVTHHGIYCGDGTVIHFDGNGKPSGQAKIRRDSLEKFCHPLPVSEILVFNPCPPDQHSYADAIIQRAESCIGKSGYDLFRNNCEHFATYCMTNVWKSGQSDQLYESAGKNFRSVGRLLEQSHSRETLHKIAKNAAKTQTDPVKSAVAYTGVFAGLAALGGILTAGSYAAEKISKMKSLRKSKSPQESSETPSPGANQAVRGDDLRLDLKLAFREAAFGGDKEIKISHLEQCQTCAGTGSPKKMLTRSSCSNCNGEGRIQEAKLLRISIPAGVDTGTRLRVTGSGDAGGFGGSEGDLYVYLFVDEDEELKRDGTNILSIIKISQAQADSGCNLNINILDGSGSLKIPSGTQNGAVLRLSGRGVPHFGNPSERGDHLVTVNVMQAKFFEATLL